MSVTLRFNGPPSPGYALDGETWVDDLGSDVGLPGLTNGPLQRRVMSGEAVTLDGDGWRIVAQNPDDPAAYLPDAILLDTPGGQRTALPRAHWSSEDEPSAQFAKIDDVKARVGDNPEKARAELALEQGRGDAARSTLVAWLETVAGDPLATDDNAGAPAGTEG